MAVVQRNCEGVKIVSDKERLENMSPIGFDLNGDVLLRNEDYHWLMEQAERVEELEKQRNERTHLLNAEVARNVRYKKVLDELWKMAKRALEE